MGIETETLNKELVQAYMCTYLAAKIYKTVRIDGLQHDELKAFNKISKGFHVLMKRHNRDTQETRQAIKFVADKLVKLLNAGIDIIEADKFDFDEIVEDIINTYK